MPCGWASGRASANRSVTFTKRTLSSGTSWRSRLAAASSSIAGIVPQPASTMSGWPASVLAHSQIVAPLSTCSRASSIDSHCGSGCFEAITRLIVRVDWCTFSIVASSVFASGGR